MADFSIQRIRLVEDDDDDGKFFVLDTKKGTIISGPFECQAEADKSYMEDGVIPLIQDKGDWLLHIEKRIKHRFRKLLKMFVMSHKEDVDPEALDDILCWMDEHPVVFCSRYLDSCIERLKGK